MKLAFLLVGGQKESWLEEICEDYQKKLNYFAKTEIIRLKPTKLARGSNEQKVTEETQEILRHIKKDDLLILCDEHGDEFDSKKFSAKLVQCFERGKARVVILVGGAFGVGDDIRQRADWKWSLSKLVFNHHIAQAVALEQTYRAFAIWKNLPYHNE